MTPTTAQVSHAQGIGALNTLSEKTRADLTHQIRIKLIAYNICQEFKKGCSLPSIFHSPILETKNVKVWFF